MTHSSRNCVRCGKDLEDAASLEVGIGPICRKLDNKLLATLIPADVTLAQKFFTKVNTLANAACAHTLAKVDTALQNASNDDWRETVKRVEWTLSHNLPQDTRVALIGLVGALGYVGLVSLWLGEAATGKTLVTFEAGRLFVQGPRQKAGQAALKAIFGRKFHPAVGQLKARWSVPANQTAAFQLAITKHWPNNEGLEESISAALAYQTEAPVTTLVQPSDPRSSLTVSFETPATKAKSEPEVLVTLNGNTLSVKAPYNPGFIAAIKTLPFKDRGWDKVAKVWTVNAAHKATVDKLIADFYKVAA